MAGGFLSGMDSSPGTVMQAATSIMWQRFGKLFRQMFAALLLLGALLLGGEFLLRGRKGLERVVTCQSAMAYQGLLQESAFQHHELRSQYTAIVQPVPGRLIEIKTDKFGCRDAQLRAAATATEDHYRILMLGDELIFGGTVPYGATVPARLQRFLERETSRDLEVLNGGVPGYCPLLALLRFQHQLQELKPDLVILHVDMSDIYDDQIYRSLLEVEGTEVVCRHPSLRLPSKSKTPLVDLLGRSSLAGYVFSAVRSQGPEWLAIRGEAAGQSRFEWISDHPEDMRLQIRHALEPLAELRTAVEQSGGQLLVTTCPVIWQVLAGSECPQLTRSCRIRGTTPFSSRFPFDVLGRYCEQEHIHYLDCSESFRRGADTSKLFDRALPTLSERGMAYYAKLISDYIVSDPPAQW